MEKDPVCGMSVDRFKTAHRSKFGGRTFFFCGAGCKARFDAEPEAFARKPAMPDREAAQH